LSISRNMFSQAERFMKRAKTAMIMFTSRAR
jgi:hypothetical protein